MTSELTEATAKLSGTYARFLVDLLAEESQWALRAGHITEGGDSGLQSSSAQMVRSILDHYLFDEPLPRHKKAPRRTLGARTA